jgi:hypothetical protein
VLISRRAARELRWRAHFGGGLVGHEGLGVTIIASENWAATVVPRIRIVIRVCVTVTTDTGVHDFSGHPRCAKIVQSLKSRFLQKSL